MILNIKALQHFENATPIAIVLGFFHWIRETLGVHNVEESGSMHPQIAALRWIVRGTLAMNTTYTSCSHLGC